MNNQTTILDMNNQPINVELVCYFNNNNKKYIFYTRNETVQDGLIKMYVASENVGISTEISQDEWNELKKIMQGIITGSVNNIEYLPYSNSIKFNEGKAIALNDANINDIKTAYKNSVSTSGDAVLNKDILSQSFESSIPKVETPEPVQINSIPQNQNNFNMESTPVNLNTNPPVQEVNSNPFDSVPNIEPIGVNNTPLDLNVSPLDSSNNNESALNINNIKPSGIESGFKVSNEPNIFDQPIIPTITENEINKPLVEESVPQNNFNIFNQQPSSADNSISKSDVSNDKKIALNARKIKLFEELASIYKEENELLKNEESSNQDVLQHTASNLFNSNGTLNENEVLN